MALGGDRLGHRTAPTDSGYGWMVAAGTCLVSMMLVIPGTSFGIILQDTLTEFDTNTSTASWTMAISLGVSSIISPLVTVCISLSSCRVTAFVGGLILSAGMMLSCFAEDIGTLFLTYGLLTGIGYGCNRIATAVVLGQYFHRRYAVATGIMMAGFSISRIIFSSLIQLTKERYGLRGTFLITGAMCLNICVGAALFRPAKWQYVQEMRPNEAGAVNDSNGVHDETSFTTDANVSQDEIIALSQKDTSNNNNLNHTTMDQHKPTSQSLICRYIDVTLLRDKSFYTITASTIPFQVVFIYSSIFLVPLGRDKGYEPMDAAMVQSYKAFGEVAGRLGIPWFLALTDCEPMSAYLIMSLLNGFAFIAHALSEGYLLFNITALLSSFLCGGIAIQGYHLTLLCVGQQKLSSALGLCALFVGIFVLAAGPILGYVRDVTGTLVNSFLIIAALQFISGLAWIHRVLHFWRKKWATQTTVDSCRQMITVHTGT